jgi:hypothetical protein
MSQILSFFYAVILFSLQCHFLPRRGIQQKAAFEGHGRLRVLMAVLIVVHHNQFNYLKINRKSKEKKHNNKKSRNSRFDQKCHLNNQQRNLSQFASKKMFRLHTLHVIKSV